MDWPIYLTTVGHGTVTYTTSGDEVTFTASANIHHHFVKYVVSPKSTFLISDTNEYTLANTDLEKVISADESFESLEAEFTFEPDQAVYITAYFEEDPKIHLNAVSDTPHTTIYVSVNDQYDPFTTVLWARPFPGYSFYMWSDGSYENPRSLYVDRNNTIVALFKTAPNTDGIYEYRCFVKDQSNLTDLPKAFLKAYKFETNVDLMTRANSTVYVYDPPDTIENGDILVLYDPKGTTIYSGVIKSIETENELEYAHHNFIEKKITCSQMQSFYKGQWVYEKGEAPPSTFDNGWYFEKYAKLETTYPYNNDVDALTPASTSTYNDNAIGISMNIGDNYTARCTTYVWCSKPTIINATVITRDNGSVYINDTLLGEVDADTETMVEFPCVKGMNKLVVLYTEATGTDGWDVYLNYLSFPAYNATKTYAVGDYVGYSEAIYQCKTAITTPEKWDANHWNKITTKLRLTLLGSVLGLNSTKATDLYLEKCIKNIVDYYSSGYIVGSDFVDQQIANRLSGITTQYVGSTLVSLPTYSVGETMDFEEFIYYLYEHYGIIFEFEINVSGPNYVTIRIPDYSPVNVGDNIYAIANMNPVTTIEETNRLIIFAGDDVTYRATWVATETGVYEATSEEATRMKTTNTEIVFSDDPISDIVASYLPTQMYNHHLSFTLILKNFVYDFDQFKLGGPLNIYTVNDYYDSVLTGYSISKDANTNISAVDFVCGKVRQKLTQLLTLKKI